MQGVPTSLKAQLGEEVGSKPEVVSKLLSVFPGGFWSDFRFKIQRVQLSKQVLNTFIAL